MEKRRLIPAIITFLGCLVTCLVVIKNQYTALQSMTIILVVLVIFYIVGLIVEYVVGRYLTIEDEEDEADSEQEEAATDSGDTEETVEDKTDATNAGAKVSEK